MVRLVNEQRGKAGLKPVVLGDNIAAQLHAEGLLAGCVTGHWGTDGLKPYMRYSLAGGGQANGENVSGLHYCIRPEEGYRAITADWQVSDKIREAVLSWMDSPGHRDTMLNPHYQKLNVGLAWDRYNFTAVQQFEGDYIEFDIRPRIANGFLSMDGKTKQGLRFERAADLGVSIYYDPPPQPLTRGQLALAYCSDSGIQVAALRHPLPPGWSWNGDSFFKNSTACLDPYDVPSNTLPPQSEKEAHRFYSVARSAPLKPFIETGPWITAQRWQVAVDGFGFDANLSQVLAEHGPGVYTVLVWGPVNGEQIVVAQYSIFHQVEPPATYFSDRWDK